MRQDHTFRLTERLLYEYKYQDSAIKTLQGELEAFDDDLPSCSTSIVLSQGKTGPQSQTEKWALRQVEKASRLDRRIADKKRQRDCIKEARQQLTEEESQFVWMRYDHEKPHHEIWPALHMSRSAYFEFRKATIAKIAKYIGL